MKYAVLVGLSFSTPALRDNLDQAIKNRMLGKATWGAVGLGKGLDKEGNPSHSLEIRFERKADMDDLFSFIKGRMDALPVLKGVITKHPCDHDGSSKGCVIAEEYIK